MIYHQPGKVISASTNNHKDAENRKKNWEMEGYTVVIKEKNGIYLIEARIGELLNV